MEQNMIFKTNMSMLEKLDIVATLHHNDYITFVDSNWKPEYIIARFTVSQSEVTPCTIEEVLDQHITSFLEKHSLGYENGKIGIDSVSPFQVSHQLDDDTDSWTTRFDMMIVLDAPSVYTDRFRIAAGFFPSFGCRRLTASNTHIVLSQLFSKNNTRWIVSVDDVFEVHTKTKTMNEVLLCHLMNQKKTLSVQDEKKTEQPITFKR
tara:strand:- start:4368 stop:4985 length:618 start_codon:yes stop_codon:yes gene_type:complete